MWGDKLFSPSSPSLACTYYRPVTHLPPTVTVNNVSKHCQKSPGWGWDRKGQNWPQVKTTGLGYLGPGLSLKRYNQFQCKPYINFQLLTVILFVCSTFMTLNILPVFEELKTASSIFYDCVLIIQIIYNTLTQAPFSRIFCYKAIIYNTSQTVHQCHFFLLSLNCFLCWLAIIFKEVMLNYVG